MALAFEEREYCLPELDALANGMATVLEHRGVRPGNRVALMSSNRPEFVIALWAIWRLGASAVLLSPAWKRTEVENALALTTPSHAVGDHPVLADSMPMLSLDEAITPGQRTFEAPRLNPMRCSCSARGRRACPRRCVTPTGRSPSRCGTGVPRCTCRRLTGCRS
jgi:non-ribosomal peptide synthetase component F